MILEGLVTTHSAAGRVNIAPMGPRVPEDMTSLHLRPFRTSTTFANLQQTGRGVFHVTDDVLHLARAAIDRWDQPPATFPAHRVDGTVLAAACRWYEFEVTSIDDREARADVRTRVVHTGRIRDFLGFNRAQYAVVEGAILATRVHVLPHREIEAEFRRLAVLVDKTAGPRERQAFALLSEFVERAFVGSDLSRSPGRGHSVSGEGAGVVTVRTGGRLHFGPLAWHPTSGRHFGGVGLMIDEPGWTVSFTRDPTPADTGSPECRQRIEECLARCCESQTGLPITPCRIDVLTEIPAHLGLGSGTQLSLAVARGLSVLGGEADVPVRRLAERVGRGRRSAVGLAGFEQGGLLVDAGLRDSDRIGALACRVTLPPEWRVVLFTPSAGPAGLSGPAEEQAFLRLGSMPLATTERLCRLVLSEMLPAAAQSDLPAFGEAVYEYGRGAGEFFATVQGGTFADARVSEVVGWLRAAGVAGVGQSSWGPTVFALVGDEGAARELLERWRLSRLGFRLECDVRVTSPRDRGATVSITSAPEHARPVS